MHMSVVLGKVKTGNKKSDTMICCLGIFSDKYTAQQYADDIISMENILDAWTQDGIVLDEPFITHHKLTLYRLGSKTSKDI